MLLENTENENESIKEIISRRKNEIETESITMAKNRKDMEILENFLREEFERDGGGYGNINGKPRKNGIQEQEAFLEDLRKVFHKYHLDEHSISAASALIYLFILWEL